MHAGERARVWGTREMLRRQMTGDIAKSYMRDPMRVVLSLSGLAAVLYTVLTAA